MRPTRVAIFAHSTNPRGGVVHAMQLAEALHAQGFESTLLAPAPGGGFFRNPACRVILIPASTPSPDTEILVTTRRREIAAFLTAAGAPRFDILHAQDSISALALADLSRAGRIAGFLRTVHHLDDFASPRLSFWQDEAVRQASALFCVSRMWRAELRLRFGRGATLVGNGVDTSRFTPSPQPRDALLRKHWLPNGGRMILALGGIESRKNTLGILRAFLGLLDLLDQDGQDGHDDLHLLIGGGASLLDHAEARSAFRAALNSSKHAHRVLLAGVVEDADMPSLYRACAMLCFASLREGFGLCVLEAMASGIPVIAPTGAPFDEYLKAGDAIRVDAASSSAITQAMRGALQPSAVRHAAHHGPERARLFDWRRVARAHFADYARFTTELSLHA